jgi:uncharacterized protein (TIGR02217 family)
MDKSLFHDVSFPLPLLIGARGGPERRTEIVELASGHEVRRSRWRASRRRYDIGVGVRSPAEAGELLAFFEAREGRRYGFRLTDPLDHSSAASGDDPAPFDQAIGLGDGVRRSFPLAKDYGGVKRTIMLPHPGSLTVAVDGEALAQGWSFADGEIHFDLPPEAGKTLTAGFLFDVPVRFGEDSLSFTLGAQGASLSGLTLQEVRL